MQNEVGAHLLQRRPECALDRAEAHWQNANVKRDGQACEAPAMTTLKLARKGDGGIGRRAWKGAEGGHERLCGGIFHPITVAQNCFGPIVVTFTVQKTIEQSRLLTCRQADLCLMRAATTSGAAIPEDQNMRLGPKPRKERLSARIGVAMVCALMSLLSGCVGDSMSPSLGLFESKPQASPRMVTMFVASTRRDDRRVGDAVSEGGLHHALVMMSAPPGHQPGVIESPTFGKPNVRNHFTLVNARPMTPERFSSELGSHISGRVGGDRDILLYVHGFNTSLDEARLRLTQIAVDASFGGVPVLFTWPSESGVLSYVSAKDRATASRDALQGLMRDLAALPGVGRVHVLAHSMGSWLAMEALRENAIAGHPDLDGKLGDVMLAAPDIDLGVFRQQMARLGSAARVSIFVSRDDKALSLSSRLAGDRPRVGAMDPKNAQDAADLRKLGVRVYDLSGFSNGFIGHGAYADAPDVIRSIGAQIAEPRKEDATSVAVIDARGAGPEGERIGGAQSPPPAAQPLPPMEETPQRTEGLR